MRDTTAITDLSILNNSTQIPTDDIKVRFLDLRVQDAAYRAEIHDAIEQVLLHGRFIMGPEHDEFENAVADFCGTPYAVGVGSGSDALYLSLRALELSSGDEVITTPLTWVATTNAIVLTGATPVFVDITDDYNINADIIEAHITPKTRAILLVHFTGQMCDMNSIMSIAQKHGLNVIEDSAQAFGATYTNKPAGSIGDMGCFSMNPMKVMNGFGEAGAITVKDELTRDRLQSLRYAGTINKENCVTPSINGRLDTIQAAILLVNLQRLSEKIKKRRKLASIYTSALTDIVGTPILHDDRNHVYYSYTINCDDRDALMAHMRADRIETKIQHPFLMPDHDAHKDRFNAEIPVARNLVKRITCIPCHENMNEEDAGYVIDSIKGFYGY